MKIRKALLIIDMQKGSFTDKTPRFDTTGVVKRINALAQKFRVGELPVIFIQHDGSKWKAFVPNTSEWELLDELDVNPNDLILSKTANDAFYNSALEFKLRELEVKDLVITGCATDFCVEATIQSALVKNYNITVVKNGHTTGDRPHLKAEQVIEQYNWMWQNMIPTEGKIEVKDFEEVLMCI
ncbi:MAG: isochorismatase family protein [Flammeovirgaceae bacterium]|nr:isochorismatase family protein [Flammeovirgaceae bacterium]